MPTADLNDIVNTANVADVASPAPQSDHPMLTAIASLTGAGMPVVRALVEELATNPNVAKTGASIGRLIGGVAPAIGGAIEGGPVGFLAGTAAAAKGAWAGGKTGWFTGKLAQSLAAPIAQYAAALEPYMPAIAALAQEGDTLHKLNSPESIGKLAKKLKPEQRSKILNFYRDQPEMLSGIMRAMQTK